MTAEKNCTESESLHTMNQELQQMGTEMLHKCMCQVEL